MKNKFIFYSVFLLISSIAYEAYGLKEIKNVKEFQQFINQDDKPLVLEFYAPWCPACMKMKPVFSKAAQAFKDQADFAALDVTKKELEKIAATYGVAGVPTIIYKKTGFESQDSFNKRLKDFLGEKAIAKPVKEQKKIKPKTVKENKKENKAVPKSKHKAKE